MSLDNLSEHEQLFYNDGYKLGQVAAKHRKNETQFLSYIKEMYQTIDSVITSILNLAQQQGIGVDCKKGCAYCCHQAVFANSYEIHYLEKHLKSTFTKAKLNAVLNKAEEKNAITSALSEEEVLDYKKPCPLLVAGSCTVYEARPMACRIYLSMKVASCIEFYKNPGNKDNFPLLLDFPLSAGRMMNEGFTAALREAGVEVAEFRMEEGLKTALTFGAKL